MSAQLSPEQVVRKFFDCYTNGRPEDFDQVVAPDHADYGHKPLGRPPGQPEPRTTVREHG